MAFRAAFSITMIITGVANTGGRIASLNRFARCSGWTRRVKEPLAPRGLCLMACPQKAATDDRAVQARSRELCLARRLFEQRDAAPAYLFCDRIAEEAHNPRQVDRDAHDVVQNLDSAADPLPHC